MKIVIDIDDNLYTRLFDNGVEDYDDAVDMGRAIRRGTPLPKGHGDLISRQAIIDAIRSMDRNDHIDEYTENVIEYFEKLPSAEKADGDLISRADLLNETVNKNSIWKKITDAKGRNLEEIIAELPTIPQTAIKHFGVMECPKCGTLFYEVPTIETVLVDIKDEIQGLIDFEESCCGDITLGYQCLGVIEDRISELKGKK